MSTIPLIFKVSGDEAAVKSFGRVKAAGQDMGTGVEASTGRAASRLGAATNRARGLGNRVKDFGGRLKNAATSDSSLFGMAGGVGLRMLSNDLIAAGDEAATSQNKLEQMLAATKQTDKLPQIEAMAARMEFKTGIDGDEFVEAGAKLLSFGMSAKQVEEAMPGLVGQARTMGVSLDNMAVTFGKSFGSVNAGGLKRTGTVLTKADMDAIKAAKSISNAAGQAELMKRVLQSWKDFGVDPNKSIPPELLERMRFINSMGNAKEAMGQGAGAFRARYQGAVAPLLSNLAQSQPGLLKGAGAAIEAGSVVAPIFTVMATIGQAMPAFKGLADITGKISGVARSGFQAMQGLAFWTNASGNASLVASGKTRIATFWTAAFGNTSLVAAGRVRLVSMTTGSALGAVGIALGALAVTAYGIKKTMDGLQDAKMGDEALEKKHGAWGKIWARGGKWLGESKIASMTPVGWAAGNTPGAQGRKWALDRQEAEERRRIEERRQRRGITARTTLNSLTASGNREQRVDLRINAGKPSFRKALAGA